MLTDLGAIIIVQIHANQAFKTIFSKKMTIIKSGQEDQNVLVTSWGIQLTNSLFAKHGIIKKRS